MREHQEELTTAYPGTPRLSGLLRRACLTALTAGAVIATAQPASAIIVENLGTATVNGTACGEAIPVGTPVRTRLEWDETQPLLDAEYSQTFDIDTYEISAFLDGSWRTLVLAQGQGHVIGLDQSGLSVPIFMMYTYLTDIVVCGSPDFSPSGYVDYYFFWFTHEWGFAPSGLHGGPDHTPYAGFTIATADVYVDATLTSARVLLHPVVQLSLQSSGLIQLGSTVNVSAAQSYDDGTIVSYDWTCSTPTGAIYLNDGGGEQTFSNLSPGSYTCWVAATDDDGLQSASSISWTVGANLPPVITMTNTGAVDVYLFEELTVSGRIDDPEGYEFVSSPQPWQFRWEVRTASGALATNYTAYESPVTGYANVATGDQWYGADIRLTFSAAGTYTVTLFATDNYGATSSMDTTVRARVKAVLPGGTDLNILRAIDRLMHVIASCSGGDVISEGLEKKRPCNPNLDFKLESVIHRLMVLADGRGKNDDVIKSDRELKELERHMDGVDGKGRDTEWVSSDVQLETFDLVRRARIDLWPNVIGMLGEAVVNAACFDTCMNDTSGLCVDCDCLATCTQAQ